MRSGPWASFLTLVSLALSIGGCAMFETGQTKLQTVKTVGIISAVGDQITVAKGGLTGLDNASRSFPIVSWGLDDLIVQQATVALSSRFQVKPVSYKRAAFAAIEESPIAPVNLVRGDPFKKLVQTEVSPQGLDAYIIITRARANFDGSSRKVEGVGVISFGTVAASYSHVYSLYEVRVIDGKTFDVIEERAAAPLDNSGGVRLAGPSLPVDNNFLAGIGEGKDENLRRVVFDLILRSLPTTLSDMHLS